MANNDAIHFCPTEALADTRIWLANRKPNSTWEASFTRERIAKIDAELARRTVAFVKSRLAS